VSRSDSTPPPADRPTDDDPSPARAEESARPPGTLEQEIGEQPSALERQLQQSRQAVTEVAAAIRRRAPRCIVMAARGSSDNAARYAQYLLGAHNGLLVSLATPSLFTLYGAPPRLSDTVVIGVSQSGRSPDIVAVLDEARAQGALGIAVTNDTSSPLAQAAAHCLPLCAGQERSIAATKTYTASLCALAMLSVALDDSPEGWSALEGLPGLARECLRAEAAPTEPDAALRGSERLFVIGRGFNYATAFEVALKIKETGYLVAEPYSSADFRHGPSAVVEQGFPVVLIAPTGRAQQDVADLSGLCRQRGAPVVAISNDPTVLDAADHPLPMPTVAEWLSPLLAVIPGQRFAVALARARGLDPDNPRGLSKVTETR
jgi:glucosamine--fructose-6-phosphate aminotransferase (isomerizing)